MDRFVIRRSRAEALQDQAAKGGKVMRQTTIGALKGVVVVERIEKLKAQLKEKDQSKEVLLRALEELHSKLPAREVLEKTRIGRTVNKLTVHPDAEVARLAATVVDDWKAYLASKRGRPLIDVRCDHQTERQREAGRKLLTGALDGEDSKALSEAIEREAFHQHGHLLSKGYRRTIRNLVFTLKQQADVRDKVLRKRLKVKDLVTSYKNS